MSVPPPHERILPNVSLTEQGLRELEIWLRERLQAAAAPGTPGWRFNKLNGAPGETEHGWGLLFFDACVDLSELPLGDDPLNEGGTWGGAFMDASGCGYMLGSTTDLYLKSLGTLREQAPNHSRFITDSGGTYQILDNLGSPLVTYTG